MRVTNDAAARVSSAWVKGKMRLRLRERVNARQVYIEGTAALIERRKDGFI